MKRTGLLIGAFDPAHLGHLCMATQVMDLGLVDRVVFFPDSDAGSKTVADLASRKRMAALAAQEQRNVEIIGEEEFQLLSGDGQPSLRQAFPGEMLLVILGASRSGPIFCGGALLDPAACDGFLIFPEPGEDAAIVVARAQALGVPAQQLPAPGRDIAEGEVRKAIAALNDALDRVPGSVSRFIAMQGLYHPPYEQMLRSALDEKRMIHSLGTRDTAVILAARFGASMQKAAVAGLLHDCAKCLDLRRLQAIARQEGLTEDSHILRSGKLLHSVVGAHLARVCYGVQDEDILNAIRFHTTGRVGMSLLELCVFVADVIEPSRRDTPGLQEIRALSRTNLRSAALCSMVRTREHVLRSGEEFFPGTVDTIRDLSEH